MATNIGLFVGRPPTCDRCITDDAAIQVNLPYYGVRRLCEKCAVLLLERGLHIDRPATIVEPQPNGLPIFVGYAPQEEPKPHGVKKP